jgi:hypothetical protein
MMCVYCGHTHDLTMWLGKWICTDMIACVQREVKLRISYALNPLELK